MTYSIRTLESYLIAQMKPWFIWINKAIHWPLNFYCWQIEVFRKSAITTSQNQSKHYTSFRYSLLNFILVLEFYGRLKSKWLKLLNGNTNARSKLQYYSKYLKNYNSMWHFLKSHVLFILWDKFITKIMTAARKILKRKKKCVAGCA